MRPARWALNRAIRSSESFSGRIGREGHRRAEQSSPAWKRIDVILTPDGILAQPAVRAPPLLEDVGTRSHLEQAHATIPYAYMYLACRPHAARVRLRVQAPCRSGGCPHPLRIRHRREPLLLG